MQFSTFFVLIVTSKLFISTTQGQQMEPDIAKFPMLLKQLFSIAKYTNLWTTELCEGLPEYQRQGCVQCFFTVASPENNQNFLMNFTDCAQKFLPDNFKLCYNIAKGTNISIPIGEIEVNLNPQNDISRGRMVIKCLKVTSKGLKGSMCLNQLKSGNPKMFSGEMSAMDFILLNNCYQKEKTDGMFDESMLMPAMGTARGKFRLSQLSTADAEDFTVNYRTAMVNLLTTFLSNEDDNQLGM